MTIRLRAELAVITMAILASAGCGATHVGRHKLDVRSPNYTSPSTTTSTVPTQDPARHDDTMIDETIRESLDDPTTSTPSTLPVTS